LLHSFHGISFEQWKWSEHTLYVDGGISNWRASTHGLWGEWNEPQHWNAVVVKKYRTPR
jgi:hypothetical protein